MSTRQATPAYHTPRTPDRWTLGTQVAEQLTRLGRKPSPWQQACLDVALETIDGPGSPWAYHTVIVFVGRRCGKTVTEMGVPLTRALQGPIDIPENGRRIPFRGAHTAQNLIRARERFLEDLAEPYIAALPEDQRRTRAQLLVNLANTTLTLHDADHTDPDASAVQVFAPTATSMRSAGLAHISIDEALVFTQDDGVKLLAAARPTMAEFFGRAQMWIMSNVGLTMQDWMPSLRDMGRAAVAAGRRDGICIVEYSMPDGADPLDETVWWDCYPALGDGLVGVGALRADLELFGPDVFAAEYLNAWPAGDVGTPALDPNMWLRLVRPSARIPAGASMFAGVDINPDGTDLILIAAAVGPDGRPIAEVARHEPFAGQRRIADLLTEWHRARPNLATVAYDPRTCATAAQWAEEAGVPMTPVDGQRWGRAWRDLNDQIGAGLTHPHPVGAPAPDVLLRHLASARTRTTGETVNLSRAASRGPISAVVALQLAVHALVSSPDTPAFRIR